MAESFQMAGDSVYLSVAGLVGSGVGFMGEDTGLLSVGAPFKRLALTSAILHGCTRTWMITITTVYDKRWQYGRLHKMWETHVLTMVSLPWAQLQLEPGVASSCHLPSAWSAPWWYETQFLCRPLRHKRMYITQDCKRRQIRLTS